MHKSLYERFRQVGSIKFIRLSRWNALASSNLRGHLVMQPSRTEMIEWLNTESELGDGGQLTSAEHYALDARGREILKEAKCLKIYLDKIT